MKKTCRFIRDKKNNSVWVPSPDSWLEGWARQRWLERYFGDGFTVRSASANSWADMCVDKKIMILVESPDGFYEISLKKFRKIEKKFHEKG